MQYLIIGAGIASASAIKAIRAVEPTAGITVVSDEQPGFYFRPMLPLLVEAARNANEFEFPPDFFAVAGLRIVPGRAVSLDPGKKTVRLMTGDKYSYDRLLIATGGSAVIPTIPGLAESGKAFALRTLADAVSLRDACAKARTGVVIGGGLVGLKAALALKARSLSVTVVEQQGQILLPRIDRQGAAMVAARLQEAGIKIMTGEIVREVNSRGLRLASGKDLEADLIVAATGTRPNTDWLTSSGIKLAQAIVTDEFQRTSLDDVYAAGDCAQTVDLVESRPLVSALWSEAVEMGRTAGCNMAGRKRKYPGGLAVMNATELAGLAMVAVGMVADGDPDQEVHVRQSAGTYRKLVFKEDRLTGAIFLGNISKAGLYTSLIRTRKPLGSLKDKVICNTLQALDLMPQTG
ncbi:MAG: hypothetical protein A2511_10040 [Deltaproteobacteria bacterium RIFOXYD12_FULL_50_9]|nr:MAG: hypothetical protein A2511_10040 [Deltaproteobacteria bacterium RIFOXYD12_FULL_50_9]